MTTFIAVLKSTCYDYFPAFQIFYSLFLYGLNDWIIEGFPIRNREGVRWERVHTQWGVVASVRVRTMGGGSLRLHQETKHRVAFCIVVSTLGLGLWPRLEDFIHHKTPQRTHNRYSVDL